MGELLAQTVPLSLGAAISPLVLMGALLVLGGQHGRARATAYAFGFAATATALLGVGVLAIAAVRDRHGGPVDSPTVDLAVGIMLIAFGLLLVRPKRKHDDARAQHHHRRWIKPDAPLYAFALFGVVMMLVNVSSIVLLIAVLKEVARSGATTADGAVALVIADLCTWLPAVGPLVAVAVGGAAVAAKVTRLGQWTTRNGKYVLCVLFVLFGLQDILKALGS